MSKPSESYKAELLKDLQDPNYREAYLAACMSESNETFLQGLRNVAEVQTGMTRLAADAGVNRENLYTMLSEEGNPRLTSLSAVVSALGFELTIKRKEADEIKAAEPIPGVSEPKPSLGELAMEIGNAGPLAELLAQQSAAAVLIGNKLADMTLPVSRLADLLSDSKLFSVPDYSFAFSDSLSLLLETHLSDLSGIGTLFGNSIANMVTPELLNYSTLLSQHYDAAMNPAAAPEASGVEPERTSIAIGIHLVPKRSAQSTQDSHSRYSSAQTASRKTG